MSTAATLPGPVSRSNTEEISVSNYCQVPFSAHSARTLIKSSPRFGTMSHHSFFSRHNPHPNRVTHIQGLNGNLVCTVRDDWGVTTSLFPHPLIKSQTGFRACPLPLGPLSPYGSFSHQKKTGLLPEAWREELKELAVKVNLASRAKNTLKPPMDEPARRKTQYSARTGRIIPPSAQAYQRRTSTQRQAHHAQPLYHQELLVLEVLSQILQTDSLSQVQRWLLLAGQREKDLVMGMIQQAMVDLKALGHHGDIEHFEPLHPCSTTLSTQGSLSDQAHRKQQGSSLSHAKRSSTEDRPERIGEAEVLEIHHEEE
ncbi:protein TBATA isoform X1 [Gadus macrocephalus]|uniref:protein TBATA isoform X1 n=1 Tax=Gadus macrocephalus TaxID=80720 RepID=UPI0028CBA2F9|nr:protein TBATA isoform X1 [Gadus macrocephalus]